MTESNFKYIPCFNDFIKSLSEVNIILKFATRYQKKNDTYVIFIKSALILLTSKFEAFLEDTICDYVNAVENIGLKSNQLPNILKFCCIEKIIDDEFISNIKKRKTRVFEKAASIAYFCNENNIISNIDIDTKFNYGKHGEKAIIQLFSRIGIENIFIDCKTDEKVETIYGSQLINIPFNDEINEMIHLRNCIIHGDETPSLTFHQIERYKNHIINFSSKLSELLDRKVINLIKLSK